MTPNVFQITEPRFSGPWSLSSGWRASAHTTGQIPFIFPFEMMENPQTPQTPKPMKEFKDTMLVSTHERFWFLELFRYNEKPRSCWEEAQGNLLRKSESPETAMLGGWGHLKTEFLCLTKGAMTNATCLDSSSSYFFYIPHISTSWYWRKVTIPQEAVLKRVK